MSRIGKLPITIPAGVTVSVDAENVVTVSSNKGTLTQKVSKLIKVNVEFSNGRKSEIEILESNFPEDLTPETYNTVSEIIPESNTWMVFDIDTKVPATEVIVDGSNVYKTAKNYEKKF